NVFREQWQPEMNLELNTKTNPLMDSVYEVILSATVTVKSQTNTVFLIEAKYAGIFTIQGFVQDEIDALLGSVVPTILFPYLRECISEIANRGSFPQLLLSPVNFEALYAEQVQKQRAEAGEETVQ